MLIDGRDDMLAFGGICMSGAFNSQLSDSEPQDVKYISLDFAPRSDAIFSLAAEMAREAERPIEYKLEGLPYSEPK